MTALPYLDPKISDLDKQLVNTLIQQEMQQMDPHKDYLQSLPVPQLPLLDTLVESKAKSLASTTEEYLTVSEPREASDLREWDRAVGKAGRNLVYAEQRRLNLELEKAYGREVWQTHLKQMESLVEATGRKVDAGREQVGEVNRNRKWEQTGAGEAVGQWDRVWDRVGKCGEIEREISRMEEELSRKRQKM